MKNKTLKVVDAVANALLSKHGQHNQSSHGRGGGGSGGAAASKKKKLAVGKTQTIADTLVTKVKGSSGTEVNLRPASGKKLKLDVVRSVFNTMKTGDTVSVVRTKAGKREEVSGTVENRYRFNEGSPWKGVGAVSVKTPGGSTKINALDSIGNMNATFRPNKLWE